MQNDNLRKLNRLAEMLIACTCMCESPMNLAPLPQRWQVMQTPCMSSRGTDEGLPARHRATVTAAVDTTRLNGHCRLSFTLCSTLQRT